MNSDDHEPVESQAPFDVMLSCYTLFEKDSADQRIDRSFLRSWPWSHLVLDEAHAVGPACLHEQAPCASSFQCRSCQLIWYHVLVGNNKQKVAGPSAEGRFQ